MPRAESVTVSRYTHWSPSPAGIIPLNAVNVSAGTVQVWWTRLPVVSPDVLLSHWSSSDPLHSLRTCRALGFSPRSSLGTPHVCVQVGWIEVVCAVIAAVQGTILPSPRVPAGRMGVHRRPTRILRFTAEEPGLPTHSVQHLSPKNRSGRCRCPTEEHARLPSDPPAKVVVGTGHHGCR